MTNLVGYLKRTSQSLFSVFLCAALLLFVGLPVASAQTADITTKAYYLLTDQKNLGVNYTQRIFSETDEAVPIREFTQTVPFTGIRSISVSSGENRLEYSVDESEQSTDLTIQLDDRIIKSNSYIDLDVSFVVELADTPVITLPLNVSSKSFKSFQFGSSDQQICEGNFDKCVSDGRYFETEPFIPSSLFMPLRITQDVSHSFTVTKNIENSSDHSIEYSFVVPSDNHLQDLDIASIKPLPDKISHDSDGNMFLTYILVGEETKAVVVSGTFAGRSIERFPLPPLSDNYWGIDRPDNQLNQILNTTKNRTFAELTPEDQEQVLQSIYVYLSDRLDPQFPVESAVTAVTPQSFFNDSAVPLSTLDELNQSLIAILHELGIPARTGFGWILESAKTESVYTWVEFIHPTNGWSVINPSNFSNNQEVLRSSRTDDYLPIFFRYSDPFSPNLNLFSSDRYSMTTASLNVLGVSSSTQNLFSIERIGDQIKLQNDGPTFIKRISVKVHGEEILSKEILLAQGMEFSFDIPQSITDSIIGKTLLKIEAQYTDGSSEVQEIAVDGDVPWWRDYAIEAISISAFSLAIILISVFASSSIKLFKKLKWPR